MNKVKRYMFVITMFVVVASFMINIGLQLKTIGLLERVQAQCQPHKSLPCESVPLRWAVDNYGCANSLLLSMNVTNVKFNPRRQSDDEIAVSHNQTASENK